MVILGKKSIKQRSTCKKPLRDFIDGLVNKLNTVNDPNLRDIMIFQGLRGKKDQNADYDAGNSKKKWPDGYHNNPKLEEIPEDVSTIPEEDKSNAVDILPYPEMWDNDEKLALLGKYGKQVLKELKLDGIISWGGDWTSFPDTPHWQQKR